jgi:hypothetical protein
VDCGCLEGPCVEANTTANGVCAALENEISVLVSLRGEVVENVMHEHGRDAAASATVNEVGVAENETGSAVQDRVIAMLSCVYCDRLETWIFSLANVKGCDVEAADRADGEACEMHGTALITKYLPHHREHPSHYHGHEVLDPHQDHRAHAHAPYPCHVQHLYPLAHWHVSHRDVRACLVLPVHEYHRLWPGAFAPSFPRP